MSSFGSISAMLISLKNNRIPKRERKLGHKEYLEGIHIGEPLQFKNKLSSHQMEAFKEELVETKRKTTRQTILIYVITLLTVAIIITYKVNTY
ncbi:MAG: hypothetical protein ACI8ZM_004078 [Crocinitomix sp.]|jgi:hypothetical protein